MKVGIIGINIYVRAMNFACPLHVYAFQQYLTMHGIESEIIDYLPNTNKFEKGYNYRHPSIYFKGKVDALVKERDVAAAKLQYNKIAELNNKIAKLTKYKDAFDAIYDERAARYDKQEDFIKKYLVLTKDKYNCAIIETTDPGFDCYICVTDIIWDKFAGTGYEPGFFLALSGMENKWKIAYSASKLVTKNDADKELTTSWIRDIDFVSVRENFMQKEMQQYVRPDIACVLDPVLLHEAPFYEKILTEPEEKDYLLLYYVVEDNNDILLAALEYAKKHNLKIIELTDKTSQNSVTKEQTEVEVIYKYGIGIDEWIGYFRNAECVFTNSFHGTCLSVLFEKNFFVGRRSNYDKIDAILETIGLSGRLTDMTNYESVPETIDNWDEVREKLAIRRKESEYFIMNALTVAKQQKHPVKDYLTAKKSQQFSLFYNIGRAQKSLEKNILDEYKNEKDKLFVRANSVEYLHGKITNDGICCFRKSMFKVDGFRFDGWRLRMHLDYHRFYMLEDGSFQEVDAYKEKANMPAAVFEPGDPIPVLPCNRIQLIVAEGVWVPEPKEEPKEEPVQVVEAPEMQEAVQEKEQ